MTTETAFTLGVIAGSVVTGALLGMIPFIFGLEWGQKTTAWAALAVCIIGHFIDGLFISIPACLIFLIIEIVVRNKTKIEKNSQQPTWEQENNSNLSGAQYCYKCGKPIAANSRYCQHCGQKLF